MFQSAVVEYDVDVANPMREEAVLLTLLLHPNFHFPTGTRQLLSLFLPRLSLRRHLIQHPLSHPPYPIRATATGSRSPL